MDEEILFLVDELQEKNTHELNQIMLLLQHPSLKKDSYTLRQFTKALLYASIHKQQAVEDKKFIPHSAHIELLPGKLQIVHHDPAAEYHPSIPKAPEPSKIALPPPVPHFPQNPSFQSAFPQPEENLARSYAIVADKHTGKDLATVDVGTEYVLHEPELFEPDIKLLQHVKEELRNKQVHGDVLINLIKKYAKKLHLPDAEELITKIKYYAMRDSRLGRIEPILRDKYVEKVKCNGSQENVKVIYLHQELPTNIKFFQDELQNFVEELLQKTNPKLDKKANLFDYTAGNLRIQLQRATKLTSPKFTITKLGL